MTPAGANPLGRWDYGALVLAGLPGRSPLLSAGLIPCARSLYGHAGDQRHRLPLPRCGSGPNIG